MLLYLWGSCIAYLVIIGDSFSSLLSLAVGKPSLQSTDGLAGSALPKVCFQPRIGNGSGKTGADLRVLLQAITCRGWQTGT